MITLHLVNRNHTCCVTSGNPRVIKKTQQEKVISFVLLSVLVAGTKTTVFLPSVALVILFEAVLGSPGGAPAEACGSMTPGHGVSAQPSNTFPYTISPSSTNLKQLQPLIDVRI